MAEKTKDSEGVKMVEKTKEVELFPLRERSILQAETEEERKQRLDIDHKVLMVKTLEVVKDIYKGDFELLKHLSIDLEDAGVKKQLELAKLEVTLNRFGDLEDANSIAKILVAQIKKEAKEGGIEITIPEMGSLNKLLSQLKQ
jgi:hypothetical protein